MRFRIAPDLGDFCCDALQQQPGLDVLLRIGIDRHGDVVCFELTDAFEQIREIGDRPIADRAHDAAGHVIEVGRQQDTQFQLLPI